MPLLPPSAVSPEIASGKRQERLQRKSNFQQVIDKFRKDKQRKIKYGNAVKPGPAILAGAGILDPLPSKDKPPKASSVCSASVATEFKTLV